MAVQIKFHNGKRQWFRGTLYQGQKPYYDRDGDTRYADGFTIGFATHHSDFGSDCAVISLTPDQQVTNWDLRD